MTDTLDDLVRMAESMALRIPTADAAELHRAQTAIFIDVRESHELSAGIIPGAVHVPRSWLEWHITPDEDTYNPVFDRAGPFVFYCGGGGRSLFAAARAAQMGLGDVRSLDGGFRGWCAAGYEVK